MSKTNNDDKFRHVPKEGFKNVKKGAFGSIYSNKLIAYKFIPDENLESLIVEVVALSILKGSSGIIQMYDFEIAKDSSKIYMDLYHGDLQGFTAYDFSEFVSIAHQVFTGLLSLHKYNIWHRDIKPQNLLFKSMADDSIRVVIADFGLAVANINGGLNSDDNIKCYGEHAYTYPYRPIDIKHNCKFDLRNDIYAMGMSMLYICNYNAILSKESSDFNIIGFLNRFFNLPDRVNVSKSKVILRGLKRPQSFPIIYDKVIGRKNPFSNNESVLVTELINECVHVNIKDRLDIKGILSLDIFKGCKEHSAVDFIKVTPKFVCATPKTTDLMYNSGDRILGNYIGYKIYYDYKYKHANKRTNLDVLKNISYFIGLTLDDFEWRAPTLSATRDIQKIVASIDFKSLLYDEAFSKN